MPNTYDPARVHPSELPIARRARAKNFDLWTAHSARTLCDLLRHEHDPDMYGFTPEEWESIAAVARGEIWPIPERPYTGDDWTRDGSFAAAPSQEVSPEIYEDMLDCLPPLRLPRCPRTEGYSSGFLLGEPTTTDPETGANLYSAFGKRGGRCYFIGLLPARTRE